MSSQQLSEKEIDFIQANTDFSREQILKWFDSFIISCPGRKIDQGNFAKFYEQLVPRYSGDKTEFSNAVFKAFDSDGNGYVDFGEFLIAFWVTSSGSLKEKLNWLFDIYDIDGGQYISISELHKMLKLLYSLKGISDDPFEKTKAIFSDIDRSSDEKISRQEFIAGCTRDKNLQALFAPF